MSRVPTIAPVFTGELVTDIAAMSNAQLRSEIAASLELALPRLTARREAVDHLGDWGDPAVTEFWQKFADNRANDVLALSRSDKVDETSRQAYMLACIEHQARVLAMVSLLRARELAEAGQARVLTHASDVTKAVASQPKTEVTVGVMVATFANESDGANPVSFNASDRVEISAPTLASVGIPDTESKPTDNLSIPGDGSVRVDRVDAVLWRLVEARAQMMARIGGVSITREISRGALINAAMLLVLRGSGVVGIEASRNQELLVELLAGDGDLMRSAAIDARLAALGTQLDRMEHRSRLTTDRLVRIEKLDYGQLVLAALQWATAWDEVPHTGTRGSIDDMDLQQTGVNKVLDRIEREVDRSWTSRQHADGRPQRGGKKG